MRIYKLKKKGFEVGKVFIYILSLLIMAFILYFGYNSIKNLKTNQDKVECLDFAKQLESNIKNIVRDPTGTTNYIILDTPGYTTEICFFDFDKFDDTATICEDNFPADICDYWDDDFQNVFIFPQKTGVCPNIKIKGIKLDEQNGFLCFPVPGSTLELKLTSHQKKVLIQKPQPQ